MFSLGIIVFAVWLLLTLHTTKCDVVPAGFCKPQDIDILNIDVKPYFNIRRWNIIYVTDSEVFRDVDHSFLELTPNGDGTYTLDSTRVLKDASSFTDTYLDTYDGNIVTQEGIDYDTWKTYQFHVYPLAVTSNNAALYVRCSNKYVIPEDTRYIAIPDGSTLSEEDEQQLLEADRKYNFRGKLVRLPYKLYNA